MMSATERRDLLDAAFAHGRAYEEIQEELVAADPEAVVRLTAHSDAHHEIIGTLLAQYRDGLPRVPLTRCPITSDVVHHAIDVDGLDGFWWNYDGAVRPREPDLPPTWFVLTGAVRLAERVRRAPFLCKPGPEVPYVIPRILEHRGVTAVVSSVVIGEHAGYAIAYFAKPTPWQLPRVNTWGADYFWYTTTEGEWAFDETPLVEADLDFDLRPWIESGKLRWIAPGDTKLALHKGLPNCPYLDLDGRREILRIEDGRVWSRQEVV